MMQHSVQNGNDGEFFKILQEMQVKIIAMDTEGNPNMSAVSIAFKKEDKFHVGMFLCKKDRDCMKHMLNLLKNKDIVKIFCDDTARQDIRRLNKHFKSDETFAKYWEIITHNKLREGFYDDIVNIQDMMQCMFGVNDGCGLCHAVSLAFG